MSAYLLNTYQAVKTLKEAGLGESQAEAIVNIMNDDIGKNLATRDDLGLLRQELKLTEQRLTIRLGGLMIAMSSLVIAAVKVL
jgi:hypothetical protein